MAGIMLLPLGPTLVTSRRMCLPKIHLPWSNAPKDPMPSHLPLADASVRAKSQPKTHTGTCPPNIHRSRKRRTATIFRNRLTCTRRCANPCGTSSVEIRSLGRVGIFCRNWCRSTDVWLDCYYYLVLLLLLLLLRTVLSWWLVDAFVE